MNRGGREERGEYRKCGPGQFAEGVAKLGAAPEGQGSGAAGQQNYAAPRTPVEEAIRARMSVTYSEQFSREYPEKIEEYRRKSPGS